MAVEYVTFYSDRFPGGATGGGFACAAGSGAYNGTITVNIPPGSTIRKAYLFAGRLGNAGGCNVIFNGTPNPFNPSNNATPNFQVRALYGGTGAVHVRDVTSQVSATQNTYTIAVPNQSGPANRYQDFYLYVAFNNIFMPTVNAYVFLNKLDFPSSILTYPLAVAIPIDTTKPVGLAGMLGYTCDAAGDGAHIYINTTNLLGIVGGNNPNSPAGICAGPHGDFSYFNNALLGFNGSNGNQAMSGVDIVSDIAPLLAPGATAFSVLVKPNTEFPSGGSVPNDSNSTWAWFLTYRDNQPAYECAACGTYAVTNNNTGISATLNWSNCATHIPADAINISFIALNPVAFQVGEVITGSISGATATITVLGTGSMQVNNITGTFQSGEAITGGTSGAVGQIISIRLPSFINNIQYRVVGSPTWIVTTVTNVNLLNISGLTSGTQYEWQVVNLDTDGSVCAPGAIQFFTTP